MNSPAIVTIRQQMISNAELGAANFERGDYPRAARDYGMACAYAESLAALALANYDFNESTRMTELISDYAGQCETALSAARGLVPSGSD